MRIGFFDSGRGGLSILESVRAHMPEYDYLYYGDTAHVPYGDKSGAEIYALTEMGVRTLFEKGVALVIIACNTASTNTLRRLQEKIILGEDRLSQQNILGVIVPTVEAVGDSGCTSIHLIGTTRTIESGKYHAEFLKHGIDLILTQSATPELVPLIESGKYDEAYNLLHTHLEERRVREGDIDGLILGCTHYGLLASRIRENWKFEVFTQNEIIPYKLQSYLEKHTSMRDSLSQNGEVEYIFTGNSDY